MYFTKSTVLHKNSQKYYNSQNHYGIYIDLQIRKNVDKIYFMTHNFTENLPRKNKIKLKK